jgi:hypothetical protein
MIAISVLCGWGCQGSATKVFASKQQAIVQQPLKVEVKKTIKGKTVKIIYR